MQIKIYFFGRLADATNVSNIELSDIISVEALKQELTVQYPGLKDERYRIAVNKKIVDENCDLRNGDEIALLPPYAGG